MLATLSWRPDETAHQVLTQLATGECVVLPTESTYELVASALHAGAVDRLHQAALAQVPSLILTDVAQVTDWLPLLTGAAARLVRKWGPGPYVLKADAGFRSGLFARLPAFAQNVLSPERHLQVRLPAHPIWSELRRADQPLIAVPIAGAIDALEAARRVGTQVASIVDGGPTQWGLPPSLVQVDGRRCALAREGGLTREQLEEFTRCRILFVCTGNTCRSPMAEALCVKLLADRLGCEPAELSQHGFSVQSAGLAATMGCEAAGEAVQVAAEYGADLTQHRSCMATVDMLRWADHVFAMTASHWYTLRSVEAPNLPAPEMLSPGFEDIADPIGRALIDYQSCAHQIRDCLNQRLPQLLES